MSKVDELKTKLLTHQDITEDMFAELTPKEMMSLAQLLADNYIRVLETYAESLY